MNTYKIFTDSCCDLPAKLADELGLTVLPLYFRFGEDEYANRLDWAEMNPETFYQKLRDGEVATTAAVPVGTFEDAFRPVLEAGEDILVLAFSSGLSTTYQSAVIAAENLKEQFPDRKIYVVDTLAASLGQGLLVYNTVQKKKEGLSIEELRDWVEEHKFNQDHWFTVDDLMYLLRGGRVSKAAAVLGTLAGIKPIMHTDNEGHLTKVSTVRGRKASLKALTDAIAKLGVETKGQTMMICHSDCYEESCGIAEVMKKQYGAKEVVINWIGPVIGAHTGPGTIGIFFTGSER